MSAHEPSLSKQARQLIEQFKRRAEDRVFEAEGGVVIYAIDNDVLSTITAPWRHQNQKYLNKLVSSDEEAQASLAYIFAEYFMRPQPESRRLPFVIVSPADDELERVWNTVYERAVQQKASMAEATEQMSHILKARRLEDAKRSSPAPMGPELEQHHLKLVRELLECVHQRRGPLAELQRITRLQNSENVLPMERITLRNEPLMPRPNAEEEQRIDDLCEAWLEKLNALRPAKTQSRTAPPHGRSRSVERRQRPRLDRLTNNEIDAAVMAKIEWINERYIHEGGPGGVKTRLCFVTGDRHIEQIGRRRRGARQYLRNPSCFLADRDFFELAGVKRPKFLAHGVAGDGPGSTLWDWLQVVFPAQAIELHADGRTQERIASQTHVAITEWGTYLKTAAAEAGLREANKEFQERVGKALQAELSDVAALALRLGNDAMTRFGVAGALAGFWSIRSNSRLPDRVVPVVKFESFPKATELIKRLAQTRNLQEAQAVLSVTPVRKLREDEDATGYSSFVVFAMAFAFGGEWVSAHTVARTAFAIAANHREGNPASRVKGDEAAYLCSVFSRLCALRGDDLEESERWLDLAEKLQKSIPLRRSLAALGNLDAHQDIRFRAERLAIRLARVHFAMFMGITDSMRDQLLRQQSLETVSTEHLDLLESVASEPFDYIRQRVELHVAINFLQLQILAILKRDDGAVRTDAALRVIALVQAAVQLNSMDDFAQESREIPSIVEFTLLCATALFAPETLGWSEEAQAPRLLEAAAMIGTRITSMPYDRARVGAILELVAQRVLPGRRADQ